MRSSRLTVLVAVTLVATTAAAGVAAAGDRPPGGGAYVDDAGNPTAVAQDGSGGEGTSGAGGADDGCEWVVFVEDDFEFYVYGDDDRPQHSSTGRWLEQVCDGASMQVVPEGGLVDPRQVAADALASVAIAGPEVATSPGPDGLVVGLASWLWIDGSWWRSYSATASAGRVTSTVTVRPVGVDWSTGEGGTVSCSGPGMPWAAGLPDSATDCSYTYGAPSSEADGGTFALTATVRFEVSWTTNVGSGGTLPAIARSSTVPVTVREVQAVGTR